VTVEFPAGTVVARAPRDVEASSAREIALDLDGDCGDYYHELCDSGSVSGLSTSEADAVLAAKVEEPYVRLRKLEATVATVAHHEEQLRRAADHVDADFDDYYDAQDLEDADTDPAVMEALRARLCDLENNLDSHEMVLRALGARLAVAFKDSFLDLDSDASTAGARASDVRSAAVGDVEVLRIRKRELRALLALNESHLRCITDRLDDEIDNCLVLDSDESVAGNTPSDVRRAGAAEMEELRARKFELESTVATHVARLKLIADRLNNGYDACFLDLGLEVAVEVPATSSQLLLALAPAAPVAAAGPELTPRHPTAGGSTAMGSALPCAGTADHLAGHLDDYYLPPDECYDSPDDDELAAED
jgi:hypothetical protein